MVRDYTDYLHDLAETVNTAEGFVAKMKFSEFRKDEKTVYATIRALEVMGEAVKRIPQKFRTQHPEIPWREIAGMGGRSDPRLFRS